MTKFSIILQVFGAISGLGVLVAGVRWLYFRLCSKKLYYTHKVYPISGKKYVHLMVFWNPTYQNISENEITKSIRVTTGNSEDFHIVSYTDKCLTGSMKIIEKYYLQINFSFFPSKGGILISYISDRESAYVEGEIKNNSIKKVDYARGKILTIAPFIALSLPFIFLNKIFQLNVSILGWVLCGYLLFIIIIFSLERYFYYPRMPKALWKAFRGKDCWY
ncbi:MAG: hypothetical protein PUK24_01655 [Elusimicrobia bacterium]|nr:hypothetical protein [Elusimicrobiota bacterium]MDY6038974.1 hypothetical protein [Elusimicrobiaceae bacterium]